MASTYLQRTFTAGNRKTFTMSAWVKLAFTSNSNSIVIFNADTDSGVDHDGLRFETDNKLQFFSYNGSFQCQLITNRVFRDTSSWYHVVVSVDTTQATSSDRVKMYINGVQETSFSTETYPSQNYDFTEFNNASHNLEVGARARLSEQYFDGSMAHVHWIDGTAYDASAFGQTDSASGIWKPKTSPSVTYGTNGFFLDFANSSDLGNDVSGNNNDLTLSGSGTQTLDTPSNVFATWNFLLAGVATWSPTFSNGNLSVSLGADDAAISNLGVSQGKWYCEVKCTNDAANPCVGMSNESGTAYTNPGTSNLQGTNECRYLSDGTKRGFGSGDLAYGSSWTTNDIIGMAVDLENNAIWFSKNGVWQNSATQTEIENGTTTNAAFTGFSGTFFIGGCCNAASGTTGDAFSVNFGNGYFGTTAVSTPESDSAGLGKFEYSVPTGYYALCTKNIADYG